jgi:microcystin-dependent protein
LATKYTTVTVSGYNASPPADDGTVSEANKVTWAKGKTKLTDPIKTALEAIDTKLIAAADTSPSAKTTSYTTTTSDHDTAVLATSGVTISLGDAASMGTGYYVTIKNAASSGTLTVSRITAANDIDGVEGDVILGPQQAEKFVCDGTNYSTLGGAASQTITGEVRMYGGSSAPVGWMLCDGTAISRTTYSKLFTAISTTFGSGNGSTTFNLPNFCGRAPIGVGTGSTTEDVTASSSNGFTVSSNTTKWVTGMAVSLSNLTGFTTNATAGPTYYIYRVSATNVRLCSTLAIAQNATTGSMVTVSGTGTATITHALTARTLGEGGGEEVHAQSSTELLAHVHSVPANGSGSAAFPASGSGTGSVDTESSGGNTAANIMSPFLGINFIIKY